MVHCNNCAFMTARRSRQDEEYISLLQVISSYGVVRLHVNRTFWHFTRDWTWISANLIECIWNFPVPVFFMITGALLLDFQDKYNLTMYFQKRIKKTYLPFIIWSAISLIINREQVAVDRTSVLTILSSLVTLLHTHPFHKSYWYFHSLFSVYLAIPIYSGISEPNRLSICTYSIAVSFIVNLLYPALSSWFNVPKIGLKFPAVSDHLIYVLIGYYLHHTKISRKTRMLIYLMGIIGLVVHVRGTRLLSFKDNKINRTFKGSLQLPCFFYSLSIYVLVQQCPNAILLKLRQPIHFFSSVHFGVYLAHMHVVNYWPHREESLGFRTLGATCIYLVTVCVVHLLHSIPFIAIIVPG